MKRPPQIPENQCFKLRGVGHGEWSRLPDNQNMFTVNFGEPVSPSNLHFLYLHDILWLRIAR